MDNSALMRKLGSRTQHQQCVPLISHFVTSTHLFPSLNPLELFQDPFLAATWSEHLGYPMVEDRHILPRVAQYAYIVTYGRDDFDAKMAYLDFLKSELCNQAEAQQLVDSEVIQISRDNAQNLSVTELALSLRITEVGPDSKNVLSRLARLPFEVYLTTTPFTLLEEALAENGKPDYVSAHYLWYRSEVSQQEIAIPHEPTVDRPLVYHLHGIETDPVSMVFTEDDYFDFFKQLAQDLRNEVQSDNRLPPAVSGLLGSKSLMLLGYSLYDWAFRSFFRGPFRQSVNTRTRGVTAQFPPEGDETRGSQIRNYLTEFFKDDKFDLYWGSIDQFADDLMLAIGG